MHLIIISNTTVKDLIRLHKLGVFTPQSNRPIQNTTH